MAKAGKGGYYAVQKGKQPGIYKTWAECEAQTKGFAGAVYKKFDSEGPAREFVKGNGYGAASSSSGGSSAAVSRKAASEVRYQPYATSAPKKGGKKNWSNAGKKNGNNAGKKGSPMPSKQHQPQHQPQHQGQLGPAMHPFVNPVFPNAGRANVRKSIVYCDGSSIGNGKTGARAGWGVFFEDPELHHLNESRRLPGEAQTNNRAELMAMIRAIQLCPNDGRRLAIQTDSQYSKDCVEKWLPNWQKRGWKTSLGEDVQNRDLIEQLAHELASRYPHPTIEKVKAHSGIAGNEIVDRMAKYGASLPETDSVDLSKRSSPPANHVTRIDSPTLTARHDHEPGSTSFTINVTVTPTKSPASASTSSWF